MRTLENKDKIAASELFCALYVCNNIFITAINYISTMFIGENSIDTLICLGTLVLFGIASLKYILSNLRIEDFVFFSVYIILFCLSYIFFPSTNVYVHKLAGKIFTSTLVPYIIVKGITDTDKFDKYFDYVSRAAILSSVLLISLKHMSDTLSSDEMNMAYSFILPVVYMFYRWLENKKEWWRVLFFATGIVVLFIAGTRGPFLCIIVFLFVYILINSNNMSTIFVSAAAFCSFLALYYSGIIARWFESIKFVFIEKGIPTRIIDMFLASELADDSSRLVLYEKVWNSIVRSPLYGNGLLGDRVATEGFNKYGNGTYAHNIILELLCHFGIFGGVALILFVAWIFVKGYRCTETQKEKGMLIVFVSVSLAHLLVSSSYLYSMHFFLSIGYAVVLIQKKNKKNELSQNVLLR